MELVSLLCVWLLEPWMSALRWMRDGSKKGMVAVDAAAVHAAASLMELKESRSRKEFLMFVRFPRAQDHRDSAIWRYAGDCAAESRMLAAILRVQSRSRSCAWCVVSL